MHCGPHSGGWPGWRWAPSSEPPIIHLAGRMTHHWEPLPSARVSSWPGFCQGLSPARSPKASVSCFISRHQTPGPVPSVPLSTGSSSCCRPSASPDPGGPFLPSRGEALWPLRPYSLCPAQLSRAGLATAQDAGPTGPQARPPQPCAPGPLMRHLLSGSTFAVPRAA